MGFINDIKARLIDWDTVSDWTDDELERAMPGPLSGFNPATEGAISGFQHFRFGWRMAPPRGVEDIMAAYTASPPFRSVVSLINKQFGAVKWFTGTKAEPDFDHPILKLNSNYNRRLTGAQGRMLEQLYLDLTGNAITIMSPTSDGKILDLWPVPETWVDIEVIDGDYWYIVRLGNVDHRFHESEVLHQKEVNPSDPYGRGRGPGFALADELEGYEYASKHVKNYFLNGTAPEFFGFMEGATKEQMAKLEDDFDKRHRGFRKHWRPAWFSKKIELVELTRSLGGERLDEMRKHWVDIVRFVYCVPPECVGLVDSSNRATAKEALQFIGTFVTDPRASMRKEFWQIHVADRFFGGVRLDYISPIPRVFDRRNEIMARHFYHFKRNEIRHEAGYPPVAEEENVYMIPANLIASEDGLAIAGAVVQEPARSDAWMTWEQERKELMDYRERLLLEADPEATVLRILPTEVSA